VVLHGHKLLHADQFIGKLQGLQAKSLKTTTNIDCIWGFLSYLKICFHHRPVGECCSEE